MWKTNILFNSSTNNNNKTFTSFFAVFFRNEKKCENFKGKTAYCDAVGYYFVVPHTPEGGGIAHLADIQSGTRSTDVNAANAHKKVVKFGKTKYWKKKTGRWVFRRKGKKFKSCSVKVGVKSQNGEKQLNILVFVP